jgi:hypothetical protein
MVPTGDNRCPVCHAVLWADDSETIGRKRCPRCEADLWALAGSRGPLFFVRLPGQTEIGFLASLAAPLEGIPVDRMEATLRTADALDLVELVLQIEESLRAGHTRETG